MHDPDASAAHDAPAGVAVDQQFVVLRLGREEYALPIDQVQEIVVWAPPRTVSSEIPWVTGVMALRGKVLAVHDLAARLGVPANPGDLARIVVLDASGGAVGVTVDDTSEVLTVAQRDLEPLPDAAGHELLRAICHVEDRLIAVLDLSTLDGEAGRQTMGSTASARRSGDSVAESVDGGPRRCLAATAAAAGSLAGLRG